MAICATLPFPTSKTLNDKTETRALKLLFFVMAGSFKKGFRIVDIYLKNDSNVIYVLKPGLLFILISKLIRFCFDFHGNM
jgi:hypothetical protein